MVHIVEKMYVPIVKYKYILFWSLCKISVEFLIDRTTLFHNFYFLCQRTNHRGSYFLLGKVKRDRFVQHTEYYSYAQYK